MLHPLCDLFIAFTGYGALCFVALVEDDHKVACLRRVVVAPHLKVVRIGHTLHLLSISRDVIK